jgi:hypothetical protein
VRRFSSDGCNGPSTQFIEYCSPELPAKPLSLVFAPTANDLGPYPELHPSLSRGAIRVFLDSEILLGKAVDPCAGPPFFTNDLDHAAAQAEIAVGVFRIKDTERDGAPEPQDVGLGPPLRCVENDILTIQTHPHSRHVRCPVWQNDADVNEHLLFENFDAPSRSTADALLSCLDAAEPSLLLCPVNELPINFRQP